MTTTTTLIASGTTDATSSDVTLEAGETCTLMIYGRGTIRLQTKDSDGYTDQVRLGVDGFMSSGQISGPVTFRVRRSAGLAAGCDMEM